VTCRGPLFSAGGKFADAAEDFKNAVSLLERQAPTVLSFIVATVSPRAYLSLQRNDPNLAADFRERARAVFEAFDSTAGPSLDGRKWLKVFDAADPVAQEAAFKIRQGPFPY
jgi:hypothetical protein